VESVTSVALDPGWGAVAILALVLGTLLIRPQGLLGTSALV